MQSGYECDGIKCFREIFAMLWKQRQRTECHNCHPAQCNAREEDFGKNLLHSIFVLLLFFSLLTISIASKKRKLRNEIIRSWSCRLINKHFNKKILMMSDSSQGEIFFISIVFA